VFDYDGVYDKLQEGHKQHAETREAQRKDRAVRTLAETGARAGLWGDGCTAQPKYIHDIIKKTEHRQREQDIINNRKEIRDHMKQGAFGGEAAQCGASTQLTRVSRRVDRGAESEFKDKEKFVTGAYREKLKADKLWEAEQAKIDAKNADVTTATAEAAPMQGFLTNLLKLRSGEAAPVGPELAPQVPAGAPPAVKAEGDAAKKRSRSRSPSPGGLQSDKKRKGPLGEREIAELMATKERLAREKAEREQKELERLTAHNNDEQAVMSAKERYLARQKARKMGGAAVVELEAHRPKFLADPIAAAAAAKAKEAADAEAARMAAKLAGPAPNPDQPAEPSAS
jgi:hypothetical protein